MAFLDEVGEKLEEEGNHQQADVHAVHIGIGGHDDFVVAQSVDAVLDVECRLQKVELFVFVDHFLGQSVGVERFSPQAEHGLRIHVPALRDGAAGRVALRNEDAAFFQSVALGIIQVDAAVT